ncbi:unnamed protein product [Didymodactylos carnosus]|uniref:Uncharacterized protein n=1 Tax=Didymodactylos carnosus TaxID=1234261 RepID=A0A815E247_9BILA|nr:unnamed protein product [Didymodactylos carnosus]CAF1311537.1 unnamed protein product [Didymodactylos carnosus]CAF4119631.1 unnamed protein product [Didymodactylos carnosus]CAF4138905.1 unnamed protein product [Didymodactylos carnosus]
MDHTLLIQHNTAIAELKDNDVLIFKVFQDMYDDSNKTRRYLYQVIKYVISLRHEFDSFTHHTVLNAMHDHYSKVVRSLERIRESDLNIDYLPPDQELLIPKLLVIQDVEFYPINDTVMKYELNEQDFVFHVNLNSTAKIKNKVNQVLTLDSIIPKKTDLFLITPLPYFVQRNKAIIATGLPHYVALSADNSSSEWNEHSDRRCTKDTRLLICSLPTVEHVRVKNLCTRSIMFDDNDNINKTCFKQEIDTQTPYIARLTSSVWIAFDHICPRRKKQNRDNLRVASLPQIFIRAGSIGPIFSNKSRRQLSPGSARNHRRSNSAKRNTPPIIPLLTSFHSKTDSQHGDVNGRMLPCMSSGDPTFDDSFFLDEQDMHQSCAENK